MREPVAIAVGVLLGALLVSSSGSSATIPTGNGKIAYVAEGGLYVVHADGSRRALLRAGAAGPARWSPDGKRFAFSTVSGVHVAKSDGSGEGTVASLDGGALLGRRAWSSDARRVAFASTSADYGVYVADVESGLVRKLAGHAERSSAPAWSPAGSTIAYVSGGDLFTVDADHPGARRAIASGRRLDPNAGVSWSPDGERLAVEAPEGVAIVRVDGQDYRLVVPGGEEPTWSPDGTRIAYSSRERSGIFRDGGRYAQDLFVVNPDGTAKRRLTQGAEHYAFIEGYDWSPDSTRIAFRRNGPLAVMNAGGTCETEIAVRSAPRRGSRYPKPGRLRRSRAPACVSRRAFPASRLSACSTTVQSS